MHVIFRITVKERHLFKQPLPTRGVRFIQMSDRFIWNPVAWIQPWHHEVLWIGMEGGGELSPEEDVNECSVQAQHFTRS